MIRQKMEIGIDTFAAVFAGDPKDTRKETDSQRLRSVLDEVELAEKLGLDIFGIGEHHRKDFLDSAPAVILAAAAARTKRIRLTSAVTVLSAADPVRTFQEFATVDLLSNGRAEMVAGRGSFVEAFPLFGYELRDYDALYEEKLGLLLKIRANEHVTWSGRFRPVLDGQGVYPRPVQNPFPIWIGTGGTPESFLRAGKLGLPLMVAIIGGETADFAPLVDLYRKTYRRNGHPIDEMKVGMHSIGYVAETSQKAADEFFPGYARAFTEVGKERGWAPVTRAQYEAQLNPEGALLVGDPEEVAEKIIRHSKSLGGLSRVTFQMDPGSVSHEKLLRSMELIATRVAPIVREKLVTMLN
jgi:probable LLM family oxidoreductase